jgi:hypothetical protein
MLGLLPHFGTLKLITPKMAQQKRIKKPFIKHVSSSSTINGLALSSCKNHCTLMYCLSEHTVSAVKTETSKKIRPKKMAFFFPDFFYMCWVCPFLQVDGVSSCLDSVLPTKSAIKRK